MQSDGAELIGEEGEGEEEDEDDGRSWSVIEATAEKQTEGRAAATVYEWCSAK